MRSLMRIFMRILSIITIPWRLFGLSGILGPGATQKMNLSPTLGFLVGIATITFAVSTGIKNPLVFLDAHAAAIVFGGTLASALICFPLKHFFSLFNLFFKTLFGKTTQETFATIAEIVKVADTAHTNSDLRSSLENIKHPFFKEALELVINGGLERDELDEILEKRLEAQQDKYTREGQTYKIIGKFPPAFGLVGATMGMIGLLQGLGEPDAFERLGPSMSVALVATFYGLVFANMVLIPVGENLHQASEADMNLRRIIVDGVHLIRENKHPLIVEEHLKSYLSPAQRNQLETAKG